VVVDEDELQELDDPDLARIYVVEVLLENMMGKRVNLGEKNRNGDTAMDLIRDDDKLLRDVFKRHSNQQSKKHSVRADDVADDDDDDDGGSESD